VIYLALVAVANTALAAYLVYENRRLTYGVIARHAGDLVNIEKAQRKKKAPAETSEEKTYHTWRNPNEGVGP